MQITLPHFWAPRESLHADRANFAAIGSLKLCFEYDWVHTGMSLLFMYPDRTDRFFNRVELLARAHKASKSAKNQTEESAYLRRSPI